MNDFFLRQKDDNICITYAVTVSLTTVMVYTPYNNP